MAIICTPNSPRMLSRAQQQFVDNDDPVAVYDSGHMGGATTALLAAAVRDLSTPGTAALIVRHRLTDLLLPGGLWDTLRRWSEGADHSVTTMDLKIVYANGSSVTFRYGDNRDAFYKTVWGSEFQFVGIDMIEEFNSPEVYTAMLSKLRRNPVNPRVPLRCRVTTHDWRFTMLAGASVVTANLADNPRDAVG